jgi:acetyl esterase/lipase
MRVAIAIAAALVVFGSGAPGAAGQAANPPGARAGVQVQRDLTYRVVDGEPLKLDAYRPAGAGVRPGVVVIYGGGWVVGNKALSEAFSRRLADEGFVAFAVDYRLAPQHPFPAAIDDLQASVRWVRAHASRFGLDPARIGALGGSAGGHLAALLATLGRGRLDRDARIAAAVSWAGPMDLHPSQYGPDSQQYLEAFLNCVGRPCDEATIVAASPISHVDRSNAPMFIADGEVDQLVPPDQVVRMSAALDRAGVRHQLQLVPDAGHDQRVVPPVVGPSLEFLRRELGGVEPAPLPGYGVPGSGAPGGDSGIAPIIAVTIAAVAVGAVVVADQRRRRRRA